MTAAVRYLSKSGNTRKVADAIAKTVKVVAEPVAAPIAGNIDLLFLGGALYGFGIDDSLKKFIAELPLSVKKVALFSTTAVVKSAFAQMKELLERRGIEVYPVGFHSWGAFTFMHKGRPNEADLRRAEGFASKAVSECGPAR
jgi:flavodoxin